MLRLHYCYCNKPIIVNTNEFSMHQLQCQCDVDIVAYLEGKELDTYFTVFLPQQAQNGALGIPANTVITDNPLWGEIDTMAHVDTVTTTWTD